MKKALIVILCLVFIMSLSACKDEDGISHIGVNAEVLEILQDKKGMLVKGLDRESIIGDIYYLNCNNIKIYFIEVINSAPIDITFEDFSVGDRITVDIKKFKDKQDEILGIQLKDRQE